MWIWSKIVENLAVVGYDTNNLLLAAYDWRLSFWNLEERDGYYSRMKASIEDMKKRHGKKVVLVAHSMGSSVSDRSLESLLKTLCTHSAYSPSGNNGRKKLHEYA